MRIVWDEPKRQTNFRKHRCDFADLKPDFFAAALVRPSYGGRVQAIGLHQGRLVAVAFLPLGGGGRFRHLDASSEPTGKEGS